jgi:hypothetical protein
LIHRVQANLHAGDLYLVQMLVVKMGDQKKMKKVVKMGAMNSRVVSYHP